MRAHKALFHIFQFGYSEGYRSSYHIYYDCESKPSKNQDFDGMVYPRETVVFNLFLVYDRWNNIPHYTQTEKYGRGPCEPSLTSYYAHHSQFSI